ncbi:MAG TPA: alpha/beta fold hydrolase [Terriglobia bacterium]|nr:alpha/beta fold hydrolase [Terriglobia bacterium]
MAKSPKLNRREFMRDGTSGLAALAGMNMAGATKFADAQSTEVLKGSDVVLERRKRYLETLQEILPRTTANELTGRMNGGDKNWEAWVMRTGELPPDFESMVSNNFLPDPLVRLDGTSSTPIITMEQWVDQRKWIRSQFEHWVYGKMPPPPDNLRSVVTQTRREGDVTARELRLEFGPEHRGILHIHLFIPDGKGPFPVFLTNQPLTSSWIHPAIRRGYLACIYDATDPVFGATDDSDRFIDVYPDFDFACIARWAWAAMRAVDYLCKLPEVDPARIGITGHSRNSKQALLAAAFDERIGAVVASSGTSGECLPWRYCTLDFWGTGSIESITGGPHNTHWFHPRLRYFAGREDKLPVDQHQLMALVAPRGLMMYAAYSEHEGNAFGYEQAYRSVLRVYRFLGREENIQLHLRYGEHDFIPNHVENYINFFDSVFGRHKYPKSETWINGYTFEGWLGASGERVDPLQHPHRTLVDFVPTDPSAWSLRKEEIKKGILWAMGKEPLGLPFAGVSKLPAPEAPYWIHPPDDSPLALLFQRPLKRPRTGWAIVPFGDGLRADLYYPLGPDGQTKAGPLPVVIWLHAYAYATGYSRWVNAAFDSLSQNGFAILAFDQLGFGTRGPDVHDFYQQYPQWSLLGKMIADARGAIDALSAVDIIDHSRIYMIGYALGGKVALVAAALDERVKAVASVCGIDPLQHTAPGDGTEGVLHYSHLHGLLPRLGFFAGEESRLPFDYDRVLALVAPRPVLIVAPTLDRYVHVETVRSEVEQARKVYELLGQSEALRLEAPVDFNRFMADRQEQVINWITRQARTGNKLTVHAS